MAELESPAPVSVPSGTVFAGLWIGTAVSVSGDEIPLQWALAAQPGRQGVSAFGCRPVGAGGGAAGAASASASSSASASASAAADSLPSGAASASAGDSAAGSVLGTFHTLRGNCEASGDVLLQESLDEEESAEVVATYTARLGVLSDGQATISGSFQAVSGEAGTFVVRLEEPSEAHVSGLWIGEAKPDSAFEYDCPVNPVMWALSLTRASQTAFGCGFFDDAGDIPGSPVLFYTLRGSIDAEGSVKLQKIYCHPVSRALTVSYEGALEPSGRALTGTWTNAMEQTFGTFSCQLRAR